MEAKRRFATLPDPEANLEQLQIALEELLKEHQGEVGHMRLEPSGSGPIGYGKPGSFRRVLQRCRDS